MRRVDPSVYTEDYYLTDCTGYREFKRTHGRLLEPRLTRIIKEIPNIEGLRVLDIGCGRGELVFWAARRGAEFAVGIDYSKAAIRLANQAKKKFPRSIQKRVQFELMDAEKLNFPKNSFDAVFLVEVMEHLYPEEQIKVFREIFRVLKRSGFVFIHTAPSKFFNDYTYRYWCYPISTLLVKINNFLTGGNYPNLAHPSKIRTDSHKIMHVNEPTYFSLNRLFKKTGFKGKIKSTNITVLKPQLSWKDKLFNLIVYLYPISNYPPFNILWGNDYISILKKR